MKGRKEMSNLSLTGKAVMLLSQLSVLFGETKEQTTENHLPMSFVESEGAKIQVIDYEDPSALQTRPNLGELFFQRGKAWEGDTVIPPVTAMSWDMCQRECEMDPRCFKFSWYADLSSSSCFLYPESVTKLVNEPRAISGNKRSPIQYSCVQDRVSLQSEDIDHSHQDSFYECRLHCLKHPDCAFAEYVASKRDCWRKYKSALYKWSIEPGYNYRKVAPRSCTPDWCYLHEAEFVTSEAGKLKVHKSVKSAQECQMKCVKDDGCRYWVYKSSQDCTLLKEGSLTHFPTKGKLDTISGTKHCGSPLEETSHNNYYKQDPIIPHFQTPTYETCQEKCFHEPKCYYWVRNEVTKLCYLFTPEVTRFADGGNPCKGDICLSGPVIPGSTVRGM